jgi:hypothetical protein
MNRCVIISLALASIATLAGAVLAFRYMDGSWAPSRFEGGLRFDTTPELRVPTGDRLQPDEVVEFVRICSALPSTSRDIGEDRGSGFVRIHQQVAGSDEFLTVYSHKNVVFRGWWTDVMTYSMMNQRAPCYVLTPQLKRFLEKKKLLITRPDSSGQPAPAVERIAE